MPELAVGAALCAAILPWSASAQDAPKPDACRAVLEARIRTCAEDRLARARAAVAPEVRGRILGYGCQTNCAKLEMFNGHTCPRP